METKARTPGNPGSTRNGTSRGGHIHRLLALATALVRAAAEPDATATDGLRATVKTPFGLDLGSLPDTSVVDWAQTLEHLGRFLTGLSVQVAGELADRVKAGRFDRNGIKTPVELLTTSLMLSRGEAYRRIR
ncbi:hypothetical protein, partial [Arthrobacter sp. GMC3]|uniref:hypothetical protein n=1 Tax=Arthrobacter sp. GMC3 TaxID=2058894 RepID=UPI0011AFD85C